MRVATGLVLRMAMEFMEPEWLSVTGELRRDAALDALLRPGPGGGATAELAMYAGTVTRVDSVAGAAARLRICRHLREHPDGQVTIIAPRDDRTAERFLELLGPLPEGVVLDEPRALPDQLRFGLMPATLIADAEQARLAGEFALDACERARVSDTRARLVAATIMELADNALSYATGTLDPPVVAATVAGRERFVEIAAVDLGQGLSESDAVDLVREIPGARDGNGFLADILRRGTRSGVRVSIEILAGVARMRWTQSGHRTTQAGHVPGTTVVVRIDPRQYASGGTTE